MIPKYRVWDIQTKRMEYPCLIGVNDCDGVYHFCVNGHWSFAGSHQAHFKLMQCTGAKDMNGTDIYTDDIIRKEICSPDDMAYGCYGDTGVVKYDNSVMGFVIDSKDDGFYDNHGMNFSFDRIEIVGNIYENPEILE